MSKTSSYGLGNGTMAGNPGHCKSTMLLPEAATSHPAALNSSIPLQTRESNHHQIHRFYRSDISITPGTSSDANTPPIPLVKLARIVFVARYVVFDSQIAKVANGQHNTTTNLSSSEV